MVSKIKTNSCQMVQKEDTENENVTEILETDWVLIFLKRGDKKPSSKYQRPQSVNLDIE